MRSHLFLYSWLDICIYVWWSIQYLFYKIWLLKRDRYWFFFLNYFTWVWVFLQRNDKRCWVMRSVPILLPVQGSLYSGKFWVLFSLKYLKLLAIMTYAQVLFLFFFLFSFCFEYCFKPPKMNCILSEIS